MRGARYGGFWRRAAAFAIDQTILQALAFFAFCAALAVLGIPAAATESLEGALGAAVALGGALGAGRLGLGMAYFTFFHGVSGRTPGKALLGLRVETAAGDPLTPGLAFLRWVGYVLSSLVFGLGFLWIALHRRKRGWHDLLAGTVVVRTRRRGGGAAAPQKGLDKSERDYIEDDAVDQETDRCGSVAQSVEHRTENPSVGSSILP